MRRVALIVSTALVGAGAVALLTSTAASAAAPGSRYTALPVQLRLVDTHNGAGNNHKGAVPGGHGISPRLAGFHGIPATATAVAATITAFDATGSGGITAYAYGAARPNATNLQFAPKVSVTDTAIVPLGAGGRVSMFNTATSGTVGMIVDVSGYYLPDTSAAGGDYVPIAAARLVDTLTGAAHNHRGVLKAGAGMLPNLAQAGVPANASSVAVTITALQGTSAGTIIAYRPTEPRKNYALVHFVPGQRATSFAVLRLDAGRAAIVNTSRGPVNVRVDVSGYFVGGLPPSTGELRTASQTRVYASVHVNANSSVRLPLAGHGGTPAGGSPAYLVTVHVVAPTRSGALQAFDPAAVQPSVTNVLKYQANHTTSNVIFAPASGGAIKIHNKSDVAVTLVVDVDGYIT